MQMRSTLCALETLGVKVKYLDPFSPWSGQSIALLHIFSVCQSTELFVDACANQHIPYVVSPILWPHPNSEMEHNRIRKVLLHAKVIMTNSPIESDSIRDYYALGHEAIFSEVVNGVATNNFRKVSRSLSNMDKNTVLCIANIDKRKNQLKLLEACLALGKRLILAGGVREPDLLEQLQRLGGSSIDYIGQVEHGSRQHRHLLATCGVFALASEYETPGLAALEAGVAGMPIVITNGGSTRSYFEGCAYFCDPASVSSICSSLEKAFSTDLAAGREVAREHLSRFTWTRAARETINAYRLAGAL